MRPSKSKMSNLCVFCLSCHVFQMGQGYRFLLHFNLWSIGLTARLVSVCPPVCLSITILMLV